MGLEKKWKKILFREYGVQYAEISLRSLSEEVGDLIPFHIKDQIYIPEGNLEVCYIDESDWDNLIYYLSMKWTINNIKDYETMFIKSGKDYLNYCLDMTPLNFSTFSDSKLRETYLKYQKYAVNYTSFIWTAYILSNIFVEKAEEVLKKYMNQDEIDKYSSSILAPVKKAATLELQDKAARLRKVTPNDVKNLYELFKWKECLDIHHPPKSIDEFKEEITQYNETGLPESQSHESILEQLKISDEDRKMIETAKSLAYIKDLRDDYRRQSVYHARCSIFKEIADRMSIKIEDVSFLQEIDIIRFLDNRTVPTYIEERKCGFMLFFSSDDLKIKCVGDSIKFHKRKIDFECEHCDITTSLEIAQSDVKGLTAQNGCIKGRVKIVKVKKDLEKIENGDILVAHTTNPSYTQYMLKASAFVTDEGGMSCHAAIVSREFKIPCIVGTSNATSVFKDGDFVEVNATKGYVKKLS